MQRLPRPTLARRQRGVTLVELMVALVIGLFIAIAAATALVISRQGFTAVDASSQLRENARFTADLMQRIVVQAGYEDVAGGSYDRDATTGDPPNDAKWPGLLGYDNAYYVGGDPAAVTNDSRSAAACGASDTSCNNFSDILIVRFQGATTPGTTTADGSMINCAGFGEAFDTTPGARAWSVFHIVRGADLEPTLACSYRDATGAWQVQQLVKGVEGFQVLYGTDGVTPGANPPAGNTGLDGAVDKYLTAKQLTGTTPAGTVNNWRRVRTVRISLLFRGDLGSSSVNQSIAWDMRGGTAFRNTADSSGDTLTPTTDTRLRQLMVFTVQLRNQQGFDLCPTADTAVCP